jgi:hypothetical protein
MRNYIVSSTGWLRKIPAAFWTGGKAYPRLANTRHKYIEVMENGNRIARVIGLHLSFDEQGKWNRSEAAEAGSAMMSLHQEKQSAVPRLNAVREGVEAVAKDRWDVTKAMLDLIHKDVAGTQRIPPLNHRSVADLKQEVSEQDAFHIEVTMKFIIKDTKALRKCATMIATRNNELEYLEEQIKMTHADAGDDENLFAMDHLHYLLESGAMEAEREGAIEMRRSTMNRLESDT